MITEIIKPDDWYMSITRDSIKLHKTIWNPAFDTVLTQTYTFACRDCQILMNASIKRDII